MSIIENNPALDHGTLTTLASQQFREVNPAFKYLNRLPIVRADEIEVMSFGPVPRYKVGTRVGEQMTKRLKKGAKTEDDEMLVLNWRNQKLINTLESIHTRMNIVACQAMCNPDEDLKKVVTTPWGHSTSTPIRDIRQFVKDAKANYDVVYDRITLAKSALRLAFSTPEFSKARDAYGELFDVEIEHTFDQDFSIFTTLVKLTVEVDDSHYRELNAEGKNVMHRVLPEDLVLFSSTKFDKNGNAADFAITPVLVPEVSQEELLSPVSYLEIDKDIEPNAVVVWSVAKGNFRRHEFTYTAVLEVS